MRSAPLRGVGLRIRLATSALLLAFALLALRAGYLSLFDPRGAERADLQVRAVVRVPAARGAILDRGGSVLAVSVRAPSVYAVPKEIRDPAQAAVALARILGTDAALLRGRLTTRSPFVFVARWVDERKAAAVSALGLPGIGVVKEPRRIYPHGELAGSILGFANIDGEGARGIERQQDEWLRGRAQTLAVERDARRRLLAEEGLDPRDAAGGEIALTLDAALQADAEAALAEAVAQRRARGGVVVLLNPHSGEILALAESPTFDPNAFRTTPSAETRSRALQDALEPGSALKPFLVAAALEQRVLGADEELDCEGGVLRLPGRTVRDLHPHDRLDVAGVLRVSSNVGAVKIALRLTPAAHHAMLRRFGFGSPTGTGFPGESAGLLRDPGDWRQVDQAAIAFGQGVSVTPLQLAAATAALANGGIWLPPRLVSARRRPGESWQALPFAPGRQAVRSEVATRVLAMLEGVVGPEGTARRAALRGVRVAGKTGTAQKLDPATGSYSDERYLAWFAGVAPAEDPRLVAVVVIDEPQEGGHTGGEVAAPVFAAVAAAQLAREGIPTAPELPVTRVASARPAAALQPDAANARGASRRPPERASRGAPAEQPAGHGVPAQEQQSAGAIARLGDRVLLPNLRGLSRSEVERIMGPSALEIELSGTGRAVSQDPPAGTVLSARSPVRVRVRFEPLEGEG